MARPQRKFFKRIYQKEPISSFLIVLGLIQVVIGGVDCKWNLFSLGLGLVLGAFVVRWSQVRKYRLDREKVMPRRYLSSSRTSQPLPRWDAGSWDEERWDDQRLNEESWDEERWDDE